MGDAPGQSFCVFILMAQTAVQIFLVTRKKRKNVSDKYTQMYSHLETLTIQKPPVQWI